MLSGSLYLELLGDGDLAALARAAPLAGTVEESVAILKRDPDLIEDLFSRRAVHEAMFRTGGDPLLVMSPFMAFALLVNRAAVELADAPFVNEWVAPGKRVPVFDAVGLREFMFPSERRVFFAELLASYTHVSSGRVWVRTAQGARRRRFSDLDPVHLAELIEVVPPNERGGIYRRLGDLALFLSGVFPDHSGKHAIDARNVRRLARLLDETESMDAWAEADPLRTLELIGRRSYRLAGAGGTVADVAERFADARRVLNFVADRYVFPYRQGWFAA